MMTVNLIELRTLHCDKKDFSNIEYVLFIAVIV